MDENNKNRKKMIGDHRFEEVIVKELKSLLPVNGKLSVGCSLATGA